MSQANEGLDSVAGRSGTATGTAAVSDAEDGARKLGSAKFRRNTGDPGDYADATRRNRPGGPSGTET
jgi:hypothetical protein